jgi:hypothetical protein
MKISVNPRMGQDLHKSNTRLNGQRPSLLMARQSAPSLPILRRSGRNRGPKPQKPRRPQHRLTRKASRILRLHVRRP